MSRVVVIGAGLAGLVAANRLAEVGVQVVLLHKGLGGLQLGQGTIDVFGYAPERVFNPIKAVGSVATTHPYTAIGGKAVLTGLDYLKKLLPELLLGDPESNYQLPTAVGAIRPTCLAQPSMIAGHVTDGAKLVIVGIRGLKDFQPQLIAENLARTPLPDGGRLRARHLWVDVPARDGEIDSSGLTYARAFDDEDFRVRFAKAVVDQLREDEIVGLPAVLGLKDLHAWRDLAGKLAHRVFEIPLPPPSVPGLRLTEALTARALAAGVRIVPGVRTVRYASSGDRVTSVTTAAGLGGRGYAADAFLLATGGFESGALNLDSHQVVRETLFDLPLAGLDQTPLIHGEYWGPEQPLFKVGVAVNPKMQAVDAAGIPVFANLYAAGGIIAGASGWTEKSGDGIALASAIVAAAAISKELA
ncbi:glycerol-3-phosphate dehydrogenase subunit GlpB [Propionicimonas sp.]|uniref:glycerol-3-phosphate dehydrogenase subunit GlpB n=1 Tax=Propionicimonas sp. TaxID=1955623 RepID=UPI00179BC24F|nr:glycerol-3-phosphate dehydrogenase subunit GlpB [Propionicimonas sp.]MBU3976359.1 glycerol-3-phosphate dehydrogenase subunit GlpB [Actinomycetota bacterium]MBA3022048.1 glycerol-3-phosphate dehydrogenase subunit GlpB [Propionicimonas sp.]MBU3987516.1 glycerol-3-phosphate dehydrogenase subunit GlpB [Actinomycetota bacterium]MBU4006539.1 glycerol-3-phosphate dehydrogenase subunit GlpB [Actinomycetota bacterium]MBU4065144.1 glycerol-3-phosphate dehydrogenase subunit GlpB [Actinomycetota bacter